MIKNLAEAFARLRRREADKTLPRSGTKATQLPEPRFAPPRLWKLNDDIRGLMRALGYDPDPNELAPLVRERRKRDKSPHSAM